MDGFRSKARGTSEIGRYIGCPPSNPFEGQPLPFRDFIDSRRTKATSRTYASEIRSMLGKDPDAFVSRARGDRKSAEAELMERLVGLRGRKLSPATAIGMMSSTRSFLDYEEVELNWRKVKSVAPAGRSVAHDRAPTLQEIRAMLSVAGVRERAMILVLATSGVRVGALPGLRLGDVELLDSVARLKIYAGEPEEYYTYISAEAVEALQAYLDSRSRIGEKLTPPSPLFRDVWDYEYMNHGRRKAQKLAPDIPHPLARDAVQKALVRLWRKAGVRSVGDGRPFKSLHGFRKWFKTNFPAAACQQHGELDVEILMGHFLNYYKPTPEHLGEVYRRALKALAIGEKYALREELQRQESDHREAWKDVRLEVLSLKEENVRLREQQGKMLEAIDLLVRERGLPEAMKEHSTTTS